MATFNTTAASPPWQPRGEADYAAIGVATVASVAVALLMSHVAWKASWPPYTAAMPQLTVYGAAGVSYFCSCYFVLESKERFWVHGQSAQNSPNKPEQKRREDAKGTSLRDTGIQDSQLLAPRKKLRCHAHGLPRLGQKRKRRFFAMREDEVEIDLSM